MIDRNPTCIGRVRHILGATVTVALDSDLAGVAPIYRGHLQQVGQIGTLVRIPQGTVDVIGTVTLLGIAELSGPLSPAASVQVGERWLQVQLIGEIDNGTRQFRRGIGSYPGLDDPVHFTTSFDLASVFPPENGTNIRIGCLASAKSVSICLDAEKLVMRHAAIVGSTGSGKTSAVATLLQRFVREEWKAANVVVIDPHGEYARALDGNASVRSVLASTSDEQLRIPFWALSSQDILRVFCGSTGSVTFLNRFNELVAEGRRKFVEHASWLKLDTAAVTSDTPVPFDLKGVWYSLDKENRETRTIKSDPATECLIDPGDPQSLQPATFEPYGPAGQPPHKAPTYGVYGTTPDILRLGLQDPRLQFFLNPAPDPGGNEDPLVEVMREWLGNRKPVSVLDFSGVPSEAADLAIGIVANLLFEVATRCQADGEGIGRPHPVLIVLEEAHRYLSDSACSLTRDAINRIAREGRKYGIGLLLVTQRPEELPKTAVAQCGTLIAMRLSNSADQGTIRAALPDTITGLANVLPSLRTGEAIVSGEAVVLPARVIVDLPAPLPLAEDPTLDSWRKDPKTLNLAPALSRWRGIFEVSQ